MKVYEKHVKQKCFSRSCHFDLSSRRSTTHAHPYTLFPVKMLWFANRQCLSRGQQQSTSRGFIFNVGSSFDVLPSFFVLPQSRSCRLFVSLFVDFICIHISLSHWPRTPVESFDRSVWMRSLSNHDSMWMRTPFTMSPSNVSIQLNHFLNSNLLLIVTLVFLLAPSAAKANWWYLGLSGVQSSAAGSNHRSLSDIKSSSFDLNPNNWPLPDSNRLQPPPAPAPTSSFYTLPSQKDAVKVILQEDAFVDRPTARRLCRRLPGLNDAQLKLCESNPSLMTAVTQGAKLGNYWAGCFFPLNPSESL